MHVFELVIIISSFLAQTLEGQTACILYSVYLIESVCNVFELVFVFMYLLYWIVVRLLVCTTSLDRRLSAPGLLSRRLNLF